jgi:hypothetical protein
MLEATNDIEVKIPHSDAARKTRGLMMNPPALDKISEGGSRCTDFKVVSVA